MAIADPNSSCSAAGVSPVLLLVLLPLPAAALTVLWGDNSDGNVPATVPILRRSGPVASSTTAPPPLLPSAATVAAAAFDAQMLSPPSPSATAAAACDDASTSATALPLV